jgi:putative ABC transport system permease protein
MLQDVRFALRLLRRSPGFALAAIATLAIGIGATTAIFTLIEAVLLRPLDVPAPERAFVLTQVKPWGNSDTFRYSEVRKWTSAAQDLGVFTIEAFDTTAVDTPAGLSRRSVAYVDADYFQVLRQPPVRGRAFSAFDDRSGAAPVAVIGEHFWRNVLDGSEQVLGRVIRIAGVPFTVVGVAAPGVKGSQLRPPIDIFLPAHAILRTTSLGPGAGNYYFEDGSPGWSPSAWLRVVVRLRDGVSREALAARLSGDRVNPIPLQMAAIGPRIRGDVSRFSTMLFVAVVLVLMIGCANIAGLVMARTESRRREIAVRVAMGISRARLVRHVLLECSLIAAAGAAAGFVLARWLLVGVSTFELPGFFRLAEVDYPLDARIVAFAILVAAAATLTFALAPMRLALGTGVSAALKGTPGGGRRGRVRHALIFGQVGITVVLLFGAGLFVHSLREALAVDVGVETGRVVVADTDVQSAHYNAARQKIYFESAARHLSSTPGVSSISWGTGPFIFNGTSTPVAVVDGQSYRLPRNIAEFQGGPDYFRTLGIRLLRGRDFAWTDDDGTPPVVVVNAAFARRFWGERDPIGHRVSLTPVIVDALVVGVAEDGKYGSLTETGRLAVFVPWRQTARFSFAAAVIVRGVRDSSSLPQVIRTQLHDVDGGVLVGAVELLSDRVEHLAAPQRVGAWLLGGFALVGLLLAVVGVYGLLSYVIAQRTREIGIRIALGASSADVAWAVGRPAAVAVLGGALSGLTASWWLSSLVTRMLFGIPPHDSPAFAGAVGLLLLAAIAAGAAPMRRATRVDPVIALRTE